MEIELIEAFELNQEPLFLNDHLRLSSRKTQSSLGLASLALAFQWIAALTESVFLTQEVGFIEQDDVFELIIEFLRQIPMI